MLPTPLPGSEASRWVAALEARIAVEVAVPVRYTQGEMRLEGHLLQVAYLSPLLHRIPKGLSRDSFVFHLRTPVYDGPVTWPRRGVVRTGPHRIEGRPVGVDVGTPPSFAFEILAPGATIAPPFTVVLLCERDGEVLAVPKGEGLAFPGGIVERALDGDPFHPVYGTHAIRRALLREVEEETGVRLEDADIRPVGKGPFVDANGVTRLRWMFRTSGERSSNPIAPAAFVPVEDYLSRSVRPSDDAEALLLDEEEDEAASIPHVLGAAPEAP